MRRFILPQFTYMIQKLASLQIYAREQKRKPWWSRRADPSPQQLFDSDIEPFIEIWSTQCHEIDFDKGAYQVSALRQKAKRGELTFDLIRSEFNRLLEDLKWELNTRIFYYVPPRKAHPLDELWHKIKTQFLDAASDADAAGNCYSFDLNTACVFHVMRVAEFGLRHIANKLNIALTNKGQPQRIEDATWTEALDAINHQIKLLRQQPRGQIKGELQLYSDAADHCTYMRDIWRNNISHAGKPYIDSEAKLAMDRVRDFMIFCTQL